MEITQKKIVLALICIFLFCNLLPISNISHAGQADSKKFTTDQWISKETYTLFVSPEANKSSFVRTMANEYHSWSKKLYANSSFIFNIFWQIADTLIGGIIWFIVALSDLFTGRFMGIAGSFIDQICFRWISVFAIFGVHL